MKNKKTMNNPIELLIQEHITIMKMIDFLSFLYSNPQKIEPRLIEKILDFYTIYVDKCHHGKEEKILFQKLKNKNLSKEDKILMNELIEEHKLGRKLVLELRENKSINDFEKIKKIFLKITTLYIPHIEKENKRFFIPAFNYFSQDEKEKILQEFFDLDKSLIHEKYQLVVEELKINI